MASSYGQGLPSPDRHEDNRVVWWYQKNTKELGEKQTKVGQIACNNTDHLVKYGNSIHASNTVPPFRS